MILKLFHQDIRTTLLHYIGRSIVQKLARLYSDEYRNIDIIRIDNNYKFYINKYIIYYNVALGLCITYKNMHLIIGDKLYDYNKLSLNIHPKSGIIGYIYNYNNFEIEIYSDRLELYNRYFDLLNIYNDSGELYNIITEKFTNIYTAINSVLPLELRDNIEKFLISNILWPNQ